MTFPFDFNPVITKMLILDKSSDELAGPKETEGTKMKNYTRSMPLAHSSSSLLVTVASLLLCLLVLRPVQAGAQEEVARYHVLELTFTSTEPGNPYIEKEMIVSFNGISGHATGHSLTTRGFWDGGSTWKVRFSPDYTGTYSYLTSSTDAGLNNNSGTITVVESERRGRIRINQDYPLYFQYSDGSPFLLVGDTWWHNLFTLSDVPGSFSDTKWENSVLRRISQKFNYAHCLVWLKDQYGVSNGQQPFINQDKDKINPQFFTEMDKRIRFATDRGLILGILPGWADHGYWDRFSTEQSRRFAQYLINRYAAYPLIWSGIGEYDEFGSSVQWSEFSNYFRNNDPYRNLVTMHPERDGKMTEEGNLDFYIVQRYSDFFGHAKTSRSKGMPYVNSEYGYECCLSGSLSSTDVLRRSWQIIMGGSAGLVYGSDWWVAADESDLDSVGARYIRFLSEFWQENDIQYWTFDSFRGMGNGRYEAKTEGGQRVYWAESSGSFEIDLSDLGGVGTAKWFDARNGSWGNEFYLNPTSSVTVTPPGAYHALVIKQGDSIDSIPPANPRDLHIIDPTP